MLDVSGLKQGTPISCGNKAFNLKRVNSQRDDGNAFDSFLNTSYGIVWHWTAGNSTDLYDDYHFNVSTGIDKKPIVFKTLKFTEKGQHLWGRNSGMIGLGFCALSTQAGNKPTAEMIDTGALLTAEICAWKRIDPKGFLKLPGKQQTADGKALYNTGHTVSIPTIADHATYAKSDGYYPDRVDVAEILPILTRKAIAYYDELKKGKRSFVFLSLLQA
jgi:hypothetical protein